MKLLYYLIEHLPALCCAVAALLCSRRLLHYFQLESYQFYGYAKTCLRRIGSIAAIYVPLPLIWFALSRCARAFFSPRSAAGIAMRLAASVLIVLSGVFVNRRMRMQKEKKPFAITARVKRLYAVLSVVLLCLCWISPLCMLLLPMLTALSAAIALPMELMIKRMYMRDAQRKMNAQPDLIRIGITGSYGKTSVKVILNTILSQKYNVLSTPASFNTPMGLTRVIRERLEPAHQVFLAEMGARHRRDIKELTDFIHPSIGVLTSVGPQHLDTFKSLDNIIETKYDLIRALPKGGFAVFFDDHGICFSLYERDCVSDKAIVGREGGDAWAENIRVSPQGSEFDLCFADGGHISCRTRLLGAHNISNILLCCAVARRLHVSDTQIQRGISLLQPVEHRLQLLQGTGGVTIIDDAFNANPAGAAAALDVLKRFSGRRIIVTPGMVELGPKEAEYNRSFGQQMAGSADICVLVGQKHTQPIQEGLIQAGFSDKNIHTFASLSDATDWLRTFMQAGDFILYENDLPDNYSES